MVKYDLHLLINTLDCNERGLPGIYCNKDFY